MSTSCKLEGKSKFNDKFKETGRNDILWSDLRVKFSRIENLRDEFPKAGSAVGMKLN